MQFDLVAGIAILSRTPLTLHTMLRGLDAEWCHATEGPETWSPHTIVGHLIHADHTDWIPRAQVILAQGANRRFPPFDRFAQFSDPHPVALNHLLDEFAQLRRASLATLTDWQLTDVELALEGEHPEFGMVTLRQLLATWVVHDLGHIAQIARVMAKQYKDAIGPWRAYLPIVTR